MSKEKISSQEIIDLIAAQAKISKKNADDFLKILFETIEEELISGNPVKIKGFGTFKLQWNEPRKSVNVQTGEEIILSGYNKVVFTPEAGLKDLINEPFSHLESISLDETTENQEETPQKTDELPDPLRIFNEQAAEIKDILSEIQSLSFQETKLEQEVSSEETVIELPNAEDTKEAKTVPAEQVIEEEVDEFEPEIVQPEFDLVENSDEQVQDIVEVEKEKEDAISEVQEVEPETRSILVDTPEESAPNTVSNEIPVQVNEITLGKYTSNKRRKRIGWIILVVILLGLGGSASYMYFYPPAFCWCKYRIFTDENIEIVKEKAIHVKHWFVALEEKIFGSKPTDINAVPEPDNTNISDAFSEPDSMDIPEPVDSLALLFNKRRTYTEFLGSERIHQGSRLTIMSKKYYGHKDFWVYIYEANKEKIADPDNIKIGTLIKIPKVDEKLIDANNPKCLDYARELHDLYVKQN